MSLSIGIVGLPNVGKSTLFNALLKKQQAYVASFPFTTIEPNVGIVPVPDPRLKKLAQVVKESKGLKTLPIVPTTVKFVDIAGLVANAHKGEGLGNKFLAHIRETTVICHVLRDFKDPNVAKEGSINPKSDFEVVETELKLADLATLQKQEEPKGTTDKDERARWEVVIKLRQALEAGTPARQIRLSNKEKRIAQTLSLITSKPVLIVLNIGEENLKHSSTLEQECTHKLSVSEDQVAAISAKLEAELAELTEEERKDYLKASAGEPPADSSPASPTPGVGGETPGVFPALPAGRREGSSAEPFLAGLERLIKKAYATLDLITFFTTTGAKEVRAWTLRCGEAALRASSLIHTDFEKNFIKADVIPLEEFVELGGWEAAREKGKVRSEGKDYIVQDGDVIEFRIGR